MPQQYKTKNDNKTRSSTMTATMEWKHVVSVIVMMAVISLLMASSIKAPTSTVQRRVSQKDPPAKIVWLMSFPNSGTSYTLRMVKRTSLMLGASNYQEEGGDHVIPVHENHPEGPFWPDPLESKYNRPQKYVLTKTHCGFRCNDCSPSTYQKEALDFPQLCATGKAIKGNKEVKVEYSTDRVHKAVHLIRNPFDNIVSRFHLQLKRKAKHTDAAHFSKSREGFREFCNYMDKKYESGVEKWWLGDQITMLRNVPCGEDFLRYVVWHNLAFLATDKSLRLPTLVLHYEDYMNQFNDTVSSLFDFLELEQIGEPFPILPGHSYVGYFTEDERKAVKKAMKIVAVNQTWHSIKHYFD